MLSNDLPCSENNISLPQFTLIYKVQKLEEATTQLPLWW